MALFLNEMRFPFVIGPGGAGDERGAFEAGIRRRVWYSRITQELAA
jgi:hypothetical protein